MSVAMNECSVAELCFVLEQFFKSISIVKAQRDFHQHLKLPPQKRLPNLKTIER